MGKRHQRSDRRHVAGERIQILFTQASRFFPENPEWSNRCVALARRIAMKERIRMPHELRRQFCRSCYGFFVPGVTMQTRIHRSRVVVTCMACGYRRRYPLYRNKP
ncbi:ribonuclease P protein component 4 [Methanospirillum lacunae]|uniref:Ribonuclease P protein component 4 n=1 Tax=Methanospirillum lacunae TaxID=668570 RepID=A0A2V2MUM8_9EURY|nr:ribonuclease P [Methanospirillum lacunae]PWR70000.1 ribonuclease P [Methanospirillum lacunae]